MISKFLKPELFIRLSIIAILLIGSPSCFAGDNVINRTSTFFPEPGKDTSAWEVLFDGDPQSLNKWEAPDGSPVPSDVWTVADGLLFVNHNKSGKDIITKETFGNFRLVFDFKLTYAANSGIKYLVNRIKNNRTGKMVWNGPEYQIIDDLNNPDLEGDSGSTASLYLVYAPENKTLHPAGEWNHGEIIVDGNHIEQWLNGVKVVSCERGSADFRRRMSLTKFADYTNYGESPSGHIMLTDHGGDKVYFRDIKIRRL